MAKTGLSGAGCHTVKSFKTKNLKNEIATVCDIPNKVCDKVCNIFFTFAYNIIKR